MEKNRLSDISEKYLRELYDNIYDSISKNEDSFEKKITNISIGIIAVLFVYIALGEERLVNGLLGILGAVFLTLSLLSDLISPLICKIRMRIFAKKVFEAINNDIEPEEDFTNIIESVNKKVDAHNWVSFGFLSAGILFALIFMLINSYILHI
jgi:small-conductance mechanosensitive channel